MTLLGQGFLSISPREPCHKRSVSGELCTLKTNGPAGALFNPAENDPITFVLFLLLMLS